MLRTKRPNELSSSNIGESVTVCGWIDSRRDHGGIIFFDVRDNSGIVQVVCDPNDSKLSLSESCRNEYVVQVEGVVNKRPEGTINESLNTGEIEIIANSLTILNECDVLPFQIEKADSDNRVDENLRLEYRYIDLRSNRMQKNMLIRSKVNQAIRFSLSSKDFVEVETPLLVASTPEGARDFVVPSRLQNGSFYALPQSPQLFKQMLMVGGLDKYFQIVRCLRDEDLRADRQLEFSQLDLEMAFAQEEDVWEAIETAICDSVEASGQKRPEPFIKMTWFDALDKYGIDKPDLRFDMELVECTSIFSNTDFRAFQAESIKAIVVSGGSTSGDYTRSKLDALTEKAKKLGAGGLVWIKCLADGQIDSPVAKFMSDVEIKSLLSTTKAVEGDLILMVADEWRKSCEVLGTLRVDIGRPKMDPSITKFLWITEFPLFELIDDNGNPVSGHHPFTYPHLEDIDKLDDLSSFTNKNIHTIRARSYDLVCNGWELGSGSVRIHNSDLQTKIFNVLGLSSEEANEKFGFLLKAFKYGAPPHAGFAFGIDRLVAILCGEENIREVIAYPKTQSGSDPLTKAPTPIDDLQLEELGISIVEKED